MNFYSKDHLQFLRSLLDHGVKFILVGGHAAIYFNIHDLLIRNKESLQRKGEKSLLDKYDAEVLKKIIKRKLEE